MAGPLVKVDTVVAATNLHVERLLRLGKEAQLEFLIENRNNVDGWEVVHTEPKYFNRITGSEADGGDGSDVIYKVADRAGVLAPIVRLNKLHIRVLGEVYKVSRVPPVAPNEAQVYTLICGERMARANFDTTKR